MNLACLVDRDRLPTSSTASSGRPAGSTSVYTFDFNGPWPPHNFVNLELRTSWATPGSE